MKKILFLISIVFCTSSIALGSHVVGGDLTYEHVTGNDYLVKLRVYRDCSGVNIGASQTVGYNSGSLLQSGSLTVNLTNSYDLPGFCPTAQTNCQNMLSQNLGFQVFEYEGVVTLPGNAADWKFIYNTCCRNAGIINIGNTGTAFMANLDNLNTPLNNSVQYPSAFRLVYNVGQSYNIALSPVDPDGDSLDAHFIAPYSGAGPVYSNPNSFTFNAGYSITQPFNSTGPIVLDASTGNLTFQSSQAGLYVIAIEVDEYRNGIIVGTTINDMQLYFTAGSGNQLPDIVGANTNNIFTINACPSSSLNIPFTTSDPDITDSTFLWWDTTIVGANFTVVPGQNETGTFNWSPTTADVRPQPYLVTFAVGDNVCPFSGWRSYTYQIFVNQCNTDSVWAGDANADFTCNNYDVLSIGMANGSTGPLRVGATTNWQAEWCAPWMGSFLSSINYNHADCNGDGTVNSTDLAAVTANYGQVHFKQSTIGQYKTAGLPDLYCDVNSVTAERTTVSVPVMLGTTGSVMNDFYGIAGTVELLNAQTSAPISISIANSWLGNPANAFVFNENLATNKSAFTLVRNDQQNIPIGQGQIGTIEFPIDMASALGSQVVIQFSDLQLIDKDGNEIVDYNVLSDTLTIVAPTNVNDINSVASISIYPNPVKRDMMIKIDANKIETLSVNIYDPMGRMIQANILEDQLQLGVNEFTIDVSSLSPAVYILEVNNGEQKQLLKFVKL